MKEIKESEAAEYIVTDIDIKDLVPNVINNVVINIIDGRHTIFLPSDMTSMQYNSFTNGKGGVFSKDVNNYTKGKPVGKYVIVEKPDSKVIIRLISEEEWLKFQVAGLINGTIKDVSYMILKEIEKEESLTTTKSQNLMLIEDIDLTVSDEEESIEELEEDIHTSNIPLFD